MLESQTRHTERRGYAHTRQDAGEEITSDTDSRGSNSGNSASNENGYEALSQRTISTTLGFLPYISVPILNSLADRRMMR